MTWTRAMEAELRVLLRRAYRADKQVADDKAAKCTGKDRFLSPEQARSARPRREGGKVVTYHCRHCGCWHLGGLLSGMTG